MKSYNPNGPNFTCNKFCIYIVYYCRTFSNLRISTILLKFEPYFERVINLALGNILGYFPHRMFVVQYNLLQFVFPDINFS